MSSTTWVLVCGIHVPRIADIAGPYQGTERSHASAMFVLFFYPNSTLIDVFPSKIESYPDMQYSVQVHLTAASA